MMHAADFWGARYEAEACAYGTMPTAYFRRQLNALPPGPGGAAAGPYHPTH